jgi:uncharacterized membrane protein HdeD (DUF308 family)
MDQQPDTKPNRIILLLRQFFTALGVLSIMFGVFHLLTLTQGFALIPLFDGLINIVFGLLALVSADLLRRESIRVVFVVAGYVAMSLAYNYVVGRGFNTIGLIFGCFMIGVILTLWQRGDLI